MIKNKELALRLADFIEERVDLSFDMCSHRTCMMGFLGKMLGASATSPGAPTASVMTTFRAARELGMTLDDATDLFIWATWAGEKELWEITREEAVAHLRKAS